MEFRYKLSKRLRGVGLEIGAYCYPLPVPSADRVYYMDIVDADSLKTRYEGDHKIQRDRRVVSPDVIADVEFAIPVADGKLDFVVCNHLLEHLWLPMKLLEEVYRVLKERGIFFFSVPKDDPRLPNITSVEELRLRELKQDKQPQNFAPRVERCAHHLNKWDRESLAGLINYVRADRGLKFKVSGYLCYRNAPEFLFLLEKDEHLSGQYHLAVKSLRNAPGMKILALRMANWLADSLST